MNKLIITTILIFTAHFVLYGQNVLFNTFVDFDSTAIEQSFNGISLLDGNYAVATTISRYQEPLDSILVSKFDKLGCLQSYNMFSPFSGNNCIMKAIREYNDGSLLLFMDASFPNNNFLNYNFGLTKLDENEKLKWSKNYGWFDRTEKGQELLILPDGGAIMVGSTGKWLNSIDYEFVGCVIRVDSLGNELWKYRHTDEPSNFTSVCLNDKENIVVLGSHTGVDSVSLILEFDLGGELLKKRFGFEKTEDMDQNGSTYITYTNDGEYLVTGLQVYDPLNSISYNRFSYFIYKLDGNLNKVWEYFSPPAPLLRTFAQSVIELDDGDIIVGGFKDSLQNDIYEIGWINKFSPEGELKWAKTYLGPPSENYFHHNHSIYDLERTKDGNLLTTGWVSEAIPGLPQINTKIWLMKLDTAGNNVLPLEAAFIPQENNKICLGDSIQLSVLVTSTTGCYQCSWEGENLSVLSDEMAVFKPDSIGVYTFKCSVTDQADQVVELIMEVEVLDKKLLLLTEDQDNIHIGELFALSEDCGMVWSGTASTYVVCLENNAYFLAPQEGVYDLTVNSSNDFPCIEEQSFSLTVVDTMNTGINELFIAKTHLYPNPTSSKINLKTNFLESVELNIYNNRGQLMKKKIIGAGDALTSFEVSDWLNGVYFYQVIGGRNVNLQTGKFVVKH